MLHLQISLQASDDGFLLSQLCVQTHVVLFSFLQQEFHLSCTGLGGGFSLLHRLKVIDERLLLFVLVYQGQVLFLALEILLLDLG